MAAKVMLHSSIMLHLRTAACLAATISIVSLSPALAEQQAPSQHSPSQLDYQQNLPVEADTPPIDIGSPVTLKWDAVPSAQKYELRIARGGDFSALVHSVTVIQTTYTTPVLKPGQYYYQVEAFRYEKSLGRQPIKTFVVGKPLSLGGKHRLEAPQIVAPKHEEMFPTFGKVRLAWEGVPGARGYRFRLFEEDRVRENRRWKRETPPRWVTEVKQPWIEVHDAPYTSFMYLQTGLYRWDVAAIDKEGGLVGDVATGYFRMSRQWHLKERDFYLRFHYLYTPLLDYRSYSALASGGITASNARAHSYRGDIDVFPWRHWGVSVSGGNSSMFGSSVPNSVEYFNVALDFLFRWYLSIEPRGWTFITNLGLGLQEFPNIDNVATVNAEHIERPRVLGPRLGFRFYKRWNSPWELQLLGNFQFHTWWAADPSGGSSDLKPSLDGDLGTRLLYNWTENFALGAGLQGEYRKVRYSPSISHGESSVRLQGVNLNVTAQFHY